MKLSFLAVLVVVIVTTDICALEKLWLWLVIYSLCSQKDVQSTSLTHIKKNKGEEYKIRTNFAHSRPHASTLINLSLLNLVDSALVYFWG